MSILSPWPGFPVETPVLTVCHVQLRKFDQLISFLKGWSDIVEDWPAPRTPVELSLPVPSSHPPPLVLAQDQTGTQLIERISVSLSASLSVQVSFIGGSNLNLELTMWFAPPGSGSAFASLASANSASPTLFSYLSTHIIVCVLFSQYSRETLAEYKSAHLSLAFVNFSAWNSENSVKFSRKLLHCSYHRNHV